MGLCSCTMKSCLIIMCVLLWVAAGGLFYVGALVFQTYPSLSELSSSLNVLVPASIVLAAGVFLFLVGLIGCVGAFKESKCCQTTFFIFLLLIFVGEVIGAALSIHYKSEIKATVSKKLHSMINAYETEEKKEVDYIQMKLGCCGADNYSDWFYSNGSNGIVPQSCCRNESASCVPPTLLMPNWTSEIHDQGCVNLLDMFFNTNFWYIAGTALGFAVIQIIGLIATLVLMCRAKEPTYTQLSGQGYRI